MSMSLHAQVDFLTRIQLIVILIMHFIITLEVSFCNAFTNSITVETFCYCVNRIFLFLTIS